MTRSEAEPAVRELAKEWAKALPEGGREHPSFATFKQWLQTKGYGHYLNFRSTAGPEYDAELWFDQELKQAWRR